MKFFVLIAVVFGCCMVANAQNPDTKKIPNRFTDSDGWQRYRDSLQTIVNDSVAAHPYTGTYRYWISRVDKPGFERTTYEIRDTELIVKSGPYDFMYWAPNHYSDRIVYRKTLKPEEQLAFTVLMQTYETDSLKKLYSNMCIIDGLILHLAFEFPGRNSGTTLSNYYLEQIVPAITFVNALVPEKYAVYYPKEGLLNSMKNCDNILD